MPKLTDERLRLYGRFHALAKQHFKDDEGLRRGFLEKHTGKRSCTDCSIADLKKAIAAFNGIQQRSNQPAAMTPKQRRYMHDLAQLLGLDDQALHNFAKHTLKADILPPVADLNKAQATKVINGLVGWKGSKSATVGCAEERSASVAVSAQKDKP